MTDQLHPAGEALSNGIYAAKRKLRCMIRDNKRSADGRSAIGYGIRAGWWPCLEAPYVQLAVHRWRFEIWFGLPSYREAQHGSVDLE